MPKEPGGAGTVQVPGPSLQGKGKSSLNEGKDVVKESLEKTEEQKAVNEYAQRPTQETFK